MKESPPPPEAVGQLALPGTQRAVPHGSGVAVQSTRLADRKLSAQVAPPALDEAMSQLSTAVSTSGRERAAHSLLDAHVQATREQAWREREANRPPRPVSSEHRRHLRDLERAESDLVHARAVAQRLTTHVQDLEDQQAALPKWALRRRRDLATRIESTRNDWIYQQTNDEVDRAERAVETAKSVVRADSVQRVGDERADRHYLHKQWLEMSLRPYVDPNLVLTPSGPLDRGSASSRAAGDRHHAVQPQSRGYGRSL